MAYLKCSLFLSIFIDTHRLIIKLIICTTNKKTPGHGSDTSPQRLAPGVLCLEWGDEGKGVTRKQRGALTGQLVFSTSKCVFAHLGGARPCSERGGTLHSGLL